MLESTKDSAKLDAMKRIVGVGEIDHFNFGKGTHSDYIKYVLNNILNTKSNISFALYINLVFPV